MIPVYDYRRDADRNVIVRPELRGRFLRLEPAPAAPPHSHDLAGEAFLTLDGQCEFLVEDERVTCGPGQLVYVDKTTRHSLRAVGPGPCTVYLSVTPHVEPTHTFYDDNGRLPPRYDAWRGRRHPDGSADRVPPERDSDFSRGELARRYLDELRLLTAAGQAAVQAAVGPDGSGQALADAIAAGDGSRARAAVDSLWFRLRSVLEQVERAEEAWNRMAPQATAHYGM